MKSRKYLTLLAAIFVSTAGAAAAPSSLSLLDALEIGVFNIGPGQGYVKRSFDETLKKDVLEFHYSVPKASVIGVWTKSYPPGMAADGVDAVRIGINVPSPEQLQQVFVKVEIKGKNAVQNIPLHLKPGWNSFRELISWEAIGDLREVVIVARPIGGGESVDGTLYLDLEFYKVTSLQRNFIYAKVGLVFVISFLAALMTAALGRLFGQRRTGSQMRTPRDEHSSRDSPEAST